MVLYLYLKSDMHIFLYTNLFSLCFDRMASQWNLSDWSMSPPAPPRSTKWTRTTTSLHRPQLQSLLPPSHTQAALLLSPRPTSHPKNTAPRSTAGRSPCARRRARTSLRTRPRRRGRGEKRGTRPSIAPLLLGSCESTATDPNTNKGEWSPWCTNKEIPRSLTRWGNEWNKC